jgi:hypothetical protein
VRDPHGLPGVGPGFEGLVAARGVRMLVKGDGRTFKLSAKVSGACCARRAAKSAAAWLSWAAALRTVCLCATDRGRTQSLQTDGDYDGVQYQADFVAPAAWTDVELPFAGFRPTFRGRVVPNRPGLQVQETARGWTACEPCESKGLSARPCPRPKRHLPLVVAVCSSAGRRRVRAARHPDACIRC